MAESGSPPDVNLGRRVKTLENEVKQMKQRKPKKGGKDDYEQWIGCDVSVHYIDVHRMKQDVRLIGVNKFTILVKEDGNEYLINKSQIMGLSRRRG